MKEARKRSGLHIVYAIIGLAILLNGIVAPFPFSNLHGSPSPQTLTSYWLIYFLDTGFHLPLKAMQTPIDQATPFAQLSWMQHHSWQNWDSRTTFGVTIEQGLLQREILNFTQITPEPIQVVVEDYDPASCPFEDYIWTDEESYMGFRINGSDPVRVDGFWIYLRGESQGIFRYRVYGAQPGTSAATFVNTSAPLTDWIEVPISPTLEPGDEYWFWINTNETELVLNPLETYTNTFYFGLARAFGATTDTRINWVYCRDDANPDEEDEGDCYGRFGSWSYRTRDLFLNVSILPYNHYVYPTEIDMKVNGNIIRDLSSPAHGVWDSETYQPPLQINGAPREYHVMVIWPGFYQWPVRFDVQWAGTFLDEISIFSGPSYGYLDVNWVVTMIVDFPPDIGNQTILLSLPLDWTAIRITRNTLDYSEWILNDTLLCITNAEDGLWHVYCSIPMSPLILYGGLLFWIAFFIILALLISFMFYHQKIFLPQQRLYRHRLQALVDSFNDIHKIRRILVIHKETGLCLLDPIVDHKMRANLVSALIQAITAFGVNLTETEETADLIDDTASLQQITYRDFHIIVHDGQYTRNALIFKQPPSSLIDKRLAEFTLRFEERYQDVLENWVGRLNIFGDAIDLVDEYLFISLRLPHTLYSDQVTISSLSQSERVLYEQAKNLNADGSNFFISELVDHYLREKGVDRIEVFDALFKLREKGIIVPIHTEIPYEFSSNAVLNNGPGLPAHPGNRA
ncbi:MAG: hypothetical protein ACFE9D_02060 [Promethearchaeota archaeon]